MQFSLYSVIRSTLVLGGFLVFTFVIWIIMSVHEARTEEAARVSSHHDVIESLKSEAQTFENQVATLSQNSTIEDLVTGKRVTEIWLADLFKLHDASSPKHTTLLRDAIDQLEKTEHLCDQMASASTAGKQYAVNISDFQKSVSRYSELLDKARESLANDARDQHLAVQETRNWILQTALWLGIVLLALFAAARFWESLRKSRITFEELSDSDIEALGDEPGLLKLKRYTPEELNKLALAMSQSFKTLKKNIKERSEEFELQSRHMEREIAVRRMAEEQLRYAAFHDQLTGLCNRDLLLDRLNRCTDRAQRHKDYEFAVLFLDIDRFKEVNDSLGHTVGDKLLIEIAKRLESTLRSTDTLSRTECNTIARIGGDEFVILIDGIKAPDDAAVVAERLQEILSEPFMLNEHEVFITASIGIATSELAYESSENLLRDADVAMYQAKDAGRARHEVFNAQMHDQAMKRLELANDFRRAIENFDFQVYYQPIISLQTMRVCGFEALSRWNHPVRGIVSPLEFIAHAEETGHIVKLGQWVLEQACRQLKQWHDELSLDPSFSMNVNMSKRQLDDPDLVENVKRVIKETGIDGECLKLEVTESVIMTNPDHLANILGQLKLLGVEIHMDDFGTGYSSLSQLHRLPIDLLKIDREFMVTMSDNEDYLSIVQTIIILAHHIGMRVTVEGVEDADQIQPLIDFGCDYAQGFYFSKPVDAETAKKLINLDISKIKTLAA